MKTLLLALALLGLPQSPALAAGLQISSVSYGGSGCPDGSVNVAMAPDGTSLTVLYSAFTANVSASEPQTERSCKVRVKIVKPVLLGYVLESADFRGYVGLESGVYARQQVEVQNGFGRFGLNQQFGFGQWSGPLQENFFLQSVRPVSGVPLVDCVNQFRSQTLMEFNTKVQMQSQSGGQGAYALDSVDGRVQQTYRFKLVNCLSAIPFPR